MNPLIRRTLPLLSVFLVACQSLNGEFVHKAELSGFTPLPTQNRTMNTVKLRWEVRDDVAAYCAAATGMGKERAFTTPPLACAVWSVSAKECTIVTAKVTTHVALGHEVRHCFEGHFHQ
jgi:hypothetical protein